MVANVFLKIKTLEAIVLSSLQGLISWYLSFFFASVVFATYMFTSILTLPLFSFRSAALPIQAFAFTLSFSSLKLTAFCQPPKHCIMSHEIQQPSRAIWYPFYKTIYEIDLPTIRGINIQHPCTWWLLPSCGRLTWTWVAFYNIFPTSCLFHHFDPRRNIFQASRNPCTFRLKYRPEIIKLL